MHQRLTRAVANLCGIGNGTMFGRPTNQTASPATSRLHAPSTARTRYGTARPTTKSGATKSHLRTLHPL